VSCRSSAFGVSRLLKGLTADPTWDNVPTTFWSIIETTAAVTCACLPSIRDGFLRVFAKFSQTSAINSTISSQTQALRTMDGVFRETRAVRSS
jgi:hypothetical protein